MRQSPLHLRHRAEQVADRVFQEGAFGFITLRQLEVFIAASESEGCNLTAVVERTGNPPSQGMVRKRLLQKRWSREAARAFVLKLTDEGRLLHAAADPVPRNLDAALLQGPAAGAAGAVYDGTAGGRPRAGGEIRLSGYDNSPNYGGPESSWREAAVIVLVIVLVIFIVAGAIWALHRLLLGSGVVN